MGEEEKIEIGSVVYGVSSLSIIARLEVAKRLVFLRGGDKDSVGSEPELVTAVAIMDGVIRILDAHPQAGNLRHPEP